MGLRVRMPVRSFYVMRLVVRFVMHFVMRMAD